MRSKRRVINKRVEIIFSDIEVIEPEVNRVRLQNGQSLAYDILVIATGCEIRPDQIQGLANAGWKENIFDFYTLEGASALAIGSSLAKKGVQKVGSSRTHASIRTSGTPTQGARRKTAPEKALLG